MTKALSDYYNDPIVIVVVVNIIIKKWKNVFVHYNKKAEIIGARSNLYLGEVLKW